MIVRGVLNLKEVLIMGVYAPHVQQASLGDMIFTHIQSQQCHFVVRRFTLFDGKMARSRETTAAEIPKNLLA